MKKIRLAFISLILLHLAPSLSSAQSDDEIFQQVFGNQKKTESVISPILLDGIPVGRAPVTPRGGDFYVDKNELIQIVRGKIRAESLLRIENGSDQVAINSQNFPGLEMKYDEDNLALRIRIIPEARETNVISFRGPPSLAQREVIHKPEAISGYLNWRVTEQWEHPDFLNQSVEGPIVADIEGVLNFKDVVLESQWDFNDERENQWQRKDLRLTWDDQRRATRYSVGDINYGLLGFQNFRALGGLSIAKNYAIQPYLVTSPVGRNKIFLKRRSQVRIFVNGRFFREIELPAGEHDLRDLPLVRGINEVVIEIEDDVGRKERLIFPFVSEAELLKKGLHQFGYNAGVPFEEVGGGRDYDQDQFTVSAFHRYGLLNSLTAGVYAQGDKLQNLLGTEVIWGTSIGLFAIDSATSEVDGLEDRGYASRFRYRYLEDLAGSQFSRNFGLSVESFSRNFAALGTIQPNNQFHTNIDVSYSQSLATRLRGGVSYTHQLARSSSQENDQSSASVNMTYFGLEGHQFTLDVSRSFNAGDDNETEVFFSWLWTGENPKNFLLSTYNSSNQAVSAEYQHSGYIDNSQYDASARVASNQNQKEVGVEFDYIGKRMIFLANHDRFFPDDPNFFDGARTRLTLGSAVAFAGSNWTISRPITDSFAILSAKPHLYGQRIPVNSQGQFADAEIGGFFKNTILSSLTSYHYEPINLDTSYLEPGYQLGEENFVVLPTFRSGTSVIVGTDATIFVTGRLVSLDGRPVALQAGEIYPPTGSKLTEPVVFFTNRKGEFRVEGLIPGEFRMKLFDDSWQPVRFTIEQERVGIVSVGDLKVKSVETE